MVAEVSTNKNTSNGPAVPQKESDWALTRVLGSGSVAKAGLRVWWVFYRCA